MALKDIWKDLENAIPGVEDSGDEISADTINGIAHAVIDLEEGNEDNSDDAIIVDKNGRATINADELYLGDRDVLREAGTGLVPQQQAITDLTEYASFEKLPNDYGEGFCDIGQPSIIDGTITRPLYANFWQGVLTLNISGTVEFQAESIAPDYLIVKIIYQNATEEILSPSDNIYSGTFENVRSIELINNFEFMTDIEFTTLKSDVMVEGYVNGLMSAEDKESLETLKTQVGDIDMALDSIIAIQNSLIGGES